jgi:hypothetical protein
MTTENISYQGYHAVTEITRDEDNRTSVPEKAANYMVCLKSPVLQCLSNRCSLSEAETIKNIYLKFFYRTVNNLLKY